MRKVAISVAVIFMCIFMFTGCYTGKTLEERISDSQIEKMEESLLSKNDIPNEFSEIKIEVKENHITYKYYYGIYIDDLTVLQMKSTLLNNDFDGQIKTYKDEVEKKFKIRPSLVTFEFYTIDGRKIGKMEG